MIRALFVEPDMVSLDSVRTSVGGVKGPRGLHTTVVMDHVVSL
jgi:hypothetical protein